MDFLSTLTGFDWLLIGLVGTFLALWIAGAVSKAIERAMDIEGSI